MTSWASSRAKPHRGEHPPATRETCLKLITWRDQARAHLKDPAAGEPTQFLSLTHGELDGHGAVWIKVNSRKHDFKERVLRPEAFAIVRAATLFGGGVNVDDNGGDLSYVRLFGGGRNVQLARLLVGAGPDEVARQLPESFTGKSFRVVMPENHIRSGSQITDTEGHPKPSRTPTRGRFRAVRIAVDFYHHRNHARSDIGITAAEYEALLWDLFALHDAVQAARARQSRNG